MRGGSCWLAVSPGEVAPGSHSVLLVLQQQNFKQKVVALLRRFKVSDEVRDAACPCPHPAPRLPPQAERHGEKGSGSLLGCPGSAADYPRGPLDVTGLVPIIRHSSRVAQRPREPACAGMTGLRPGPGGRLDGMIGV